MRRYLFEKSSWLLADIHKLFEFHADTNNLPLISPPGIKIDVLKISDIPLKKDSEIIVHLKKFFLSKEWHIKINYCEPPKLISDIQQKGIFEYWQHYHIFEEMDGGVQMTDRIEFIPPFGMLGKLALPVIYYQLNSMFSYRHRKTQELFTKG